MIERHFHDVYFNGKSLADFGVHVNGTDVFNGPEKDVENVEVPGRNGDLHIFNGRYKNVELKYHAFIGGGNFPNPTNRKKDPDPNYLKYVSAGTLSKLDPEKEDFKLHVRSLRQHLYKSDGYCRLEDTYHDDEYRRAMYKGPFTTEAIMLQAGEFDLTFDADPRRFLKSGEQVTTLTSNSILYNPTDYTSKPLVRVYGKGSLTIGDVIITVISTYNKSYMDIDCEIQDAYYGDINCNPYINLVDGAFFELKPFDNAVTLGTGITKVEIIPNWWIL